MTGSPERPPGTLLPRAFFERPGPEVALDLLGAVVVSDLAPGRVAVQLTEVEAYHGADDPGSHAFRGRTPRNAVMFGPPGHLYVYFTYGMHWCMNLVCGPEGLASAVLLRAGRVTEGLEIARQRRSVARNDRDLARGPARLAVALGVDGSCNGADGADARSPLRVVGGPKREQTVRAGPRVGVGGAGAATPWRFWSEGDPTVSPYRAHAPRRRRKPGAPEVPRTG